MMFLSTLGTGITSLAASPKKLDWTDRVRDICLNRKYHLTCEASAYLTGKMVGVVLSGTQLAAEIKDDLKKRVEELQNNDPTFKPGLVIVQVI